MTRKIKEIQRSATFCWSPGQELVLATGTLSGTVDDSFSNASELELFKLSTQESFKVASQSRFKTIAWGNNKKSDGIIAAGKETGELELWNPKAIFNNKSQDALILTKSNHSGTLRSLDFNRLQTNLLASAGSHSEIFIWDLENTTAAPNSLGSSRSSKMEEMTDVTWNCQVQHILATSASSGNTVVWDLRNKKEILTLLNQSHRGSSISSIAWHPSVATQIVTASDDDTSPIISLWDLRHAHSPEKVLYGHTQGILDISWCRQDMDLLISSGKDGKTLCWNPNKGDLLGEIHTSTKWAHEVEWCPRNPDMLATASIDGVISIHSIQGSSSTLEKEKLPESDNPFDAALLASATSHPNLELKTPPKWLRRPIGASFGFSGKLVTFRHQQQQQSSRLVKVTTIKMNPEIIKRSEQLETANESFQIDALIDQRIQQTMDDPHQREDWKMLQTLFSENAREQLIRHLGFEKEQIMAEATRLLDLTNTIKKQDNKKQEQVTQHVFNGSSPSASPISGLFGSSDPVTANDFFGIPVNKNTTATTTTTTEKISQSLPFQLYPNNSSDTDKLITRAIILGDFESAVNVCLASERFSDAMLLAMCGGSELLTRAQNAYFTSQSKKYTYLRLLQGIIQDDLMAIVNHVALEEWASALVVICTFAQTKEFGSLCEALGDRLMRSSSQSSHAILCYLAAGNLVKVSNIWIDRLKLSKTTLDDMSYSLHLQEFIEKMTLFRKAIDYEEGEEEATKTNALMPLYKIYCEYAERMAAQGKLQTALKYINLTPMTGGILNDTTSIVRDRIFHAHSKWTGQYKEPHFPFTRETLISKITPLQQEQQQQQQLYQKQTQYSEMSNTPEPTNYYIPSDYTTSYNQQQQPTYSPTATFHHYIPQPTYNTTAYTIQDSNDNIYIPSIASSDNYRPSPPPPPLPHPHPNAPPPIAAAWNDPPLMTHLTKMSPKTANMAPVKKITTPFANQLPTTPPRQQQQQQQQQQPMGDTTRGPPSSSAGYYSARQQPPNTYQSQPIATPPPPTNVVASTSISKRS